MIPAVNNVTSLSPQAILQAPRQAALSGASRRDVAGTGMTRNGAPRFGRLNHLAERFFQPITENYLWGFMAQDVLGLWLPRIYSSLERGRIPYDPKKDANYGKRTPAEQSRYAMWKTVRGLNYWNGWEETAREIQNGPGIFIGQGFLYAGAAAWMFGKRGLLIGYKDVQEYFGQLGQVLTPDYAKSLLGKPPLRAQLELNRRLVEHLVEGHFGPLTGSSALSRLSLARPMSRNEVALLGKSEAGLYTWLKRNFPDKVARQTLTYADALSAWSKQYSPLAVRQAHKPLAVLENVFEELVCQYNNSVKQVTNPSLLDMYVLPKLPTAKAATVSTARSVLNTMEKMATVVGDVLASGRQYNVFAPGKPQDAGQISKLLTFVERTLIQKKLPLSIIATIVGSAVVTYTAILSQSPKRKYPANRLIPLPQDHDARFQKLFREQQEYATAQEEMQRKQLKVSLEEQAKALMQPRTSAVPNYTRALSHE